MQSSRPMTDKLSWKGELIQFELRESISTQTNAHHYECEVKVTSMSFSFEGHKTERMDVICILHSYISSMSFTR